MDKCCFCNSPVKEISGDICRFACGKCGEYSIENKALETLLAEKSSNKITARQLVNIVGYLSENKGYVIKSDNYEWLKSLKTPSFFEKADKILFEMEKRTDYAGKMLHTDESWYKYGWCLHPLEFGEMLKYLAELGRVEISSPGSMRSICNIAPKGWEYLESKGTNKESKQCFVAMWFDETMKNVYENAIYKGIEDAGYTPHRIDKSEHNNKIDDEIISQIRRSKFLFADFTGHRGGVYYEAGFAQGLGIEVIWSCREDQIEELHFDIRQYNCISWKENDLDDFRKKIQFRIESVLGRGKPS